MSITLGIDLGTTNSVCAVADSRGGAVIQENGSRLIPSVVSFHPNGTVLVGSEARERRIVDAAHTVFSIKRLIGRPFDSPEVQAARQKLPFALVEGVARATLVEVRGERYALAEISAMVLRHIKNVAEQSLGEPCTKAVITVPANFNELQRTATRAAGRIAGLEVVRIVNEPTAAALACGLTNERDNVRVAVFDLGGGTFDFSILEASNTVFEVVATAGDMRLGGDDIDLALAERMAVRFLEKHRYDPRENGQAFERLRVAAEWAKMELTTKQVVELRIEELAYGRGGTQLDYQDSVTRKELELAATPFIDRCFTVCDQALHASKLTWTQLDHVVLVGGQTKMPFVATKVRERFGRAPIVNDHPDLLVAKGAAIQARALKYRSRQKPVGVVGKRTSQRPDETLIGRDLRQSGAPVSRPPTSKPPPPPPRFSSRPAPARPSDKAMAIPPPARVPSEVPQPPRALDQLEELSSDWLVPFEDVSQSGPQAGLPPLMRPPTPSAHPAWPASAPPPPLLIDVTPFSLGVETVSGYCEQIISRNSPVPIQQQRVFATSKDNQRVVRFMICQGESRELSENQVLGRVELLGIPPGPRDDARIEVTFRINEDGILDVFARDESTGQRRNVRVNLIGQLKDETVETLQQRHELLFS